MKQILMLAGAAALAFAAPAMKCSMDIVDLEVAVRLQRYACRRGASLDERGSLFTDQRREDTLSGVLPDAVAVREQ